MAGSKHKISFETDIKSSILKKIASELTVAKVGMPTPGALDSYYKDPGGGGGGVYGKTGGDGVTFGKSDPKKRADLVINVLDKAKVMQDIATVSAKIKAGTLRGTIR